MRIRLHVLSVIATVTVTALFGMVLGAAFGYAAALIAPDLFRYLVPWRQLEPLGTAVILGAFGGVICGGLLGGFAVGIQAFSEWVQRPRRQDDR